MKKTFITFTMALLGLFAFASCEEGSENNDAETADNTEMESSSEDKSSSEMENTDIVPSGTYTGTAIRVDADEKEIYMETEDGKTLELYFTDQTELTQGGNAVEFNALTDGAKVKVELEKKGQRLEPISVEIM